MSTLGQKLKKIREDNQKTQFEVSEILNIEQSTWANYEKDKRIPKIDILIKIASLFNVSLDYLVGLNEGQQSNLSFSYSSDYMKTLFVDKLKKALDESSIRYDDFIQGDTGATPKRKLLLEGKIIPTIEDLKELSDLLNVSVDYFIGNQPRITNSENKMLNTFTELNEDNQDIIIGKAKELLREQRRETTVAAEQPSSRAVSGK